MKTCENLIDGRCMALKTANGRGWIQLKIEHLPKLAVLKIKDDKGELSWKAICVAAMDQPSQLQCEDFKQEQRFSGTNQY